MFTISAFEVRGRTARIDNSFSKCPLNSSNLARLLLIINGACKIRHIHTDYKINQCLDFTVLGIKKSKINDIYKFIDDLKNNRELQSYFFSNNKFYEFLEAEICSIFIYKKKENGVLCLLHCYRILEKISFALPLIYAKRTEDFSKFYDKIKGFFKNIDEKSGELSFLKSALKILLDEYAKKYKFRCFLTSHEKNALSNCLENITMQDQINGYEYELGIIEYIDFFVKIRNRYFHALSGKEHISLCELTNPEVTFLKFIQDFINIICYIISNLLAPNIE